MRFSAFFITFVASYFAKADFILPEPMSQISIGLSTRISWSTHPVAGPVSLFLVPAGVQDAGASISTIGTQIPNDGMYQWVPCGTLNTAGSYLSILMVDSKNFKTLSGTFLIVGLPSYQPGSELRRRVNSGTDSSDIGKNEGYKKSNSTETKTVNSESKEASNSVVLKTSLSACSAVVTKTKYLYLGATNGADSKTKSSNQSKSTNRPASLALYLDKPSKNISNSSNTMSLDSRGSSASNSTSSSKSTFHDSSLKHNYGLNSSSSSSSSEADPKKTHDSKSSSDSDSGKGSGSKHSESNPNSKGNFGSESSSSGYESKGNEDSSGHESGSQENSEYRHGHGNDHGSHSNSSSSYESKSVSKHTTRANCTLLTSTIIIYVSSSENSHTHETKAYTSNVNKTTLIQTNKIPNTASESLFSISNPATPASPSILASTSTLAASTISPAVISTTATSISQSDQISHISETSQLSSFATSEPIQSIETTPLFSASISIPSITQATPPPPVLTSSPEITTVASILSISSTQSTTPTPTPSTPPTTPPSTTDPLTLPPPPPPPLSPQTESTTESATESEIQTSLPPVTLTTLSSSSTFTSPSVVYNLTIQSATGTGIALPVFTGGGSSLYEVSRGGLLVAMLVGGLLGGAGWIL
ncbi:hypothetical protein EAE96_001089 [Botrytis aclada]|nr:hypothetical protein EAE96_001089 [Botrytis aclada]